MRDKLALSAVVAATAIAMSGCGQPLPGASPATRLSGESVPGGAAAATSTAAPVAVATDVSRGDFGAMSQWFAEPGSFGPIGAAASTDALVASGYAVLKRERGCPIAHVVASPALAARGVDFGDVSVGKLHGIFYSAKVRTAEGIHTGSTSADLAKAYGNTLVDTPWRWGEGGADTRARVLFDADGALVFLMGPQNSVAGMMSAAGTSLDEVDLVIGGGC